jgi:hypothetical protein
MDLVGHLPASSDGHMQLLTVCAYTYSKEEALSVLFILTANEHILTEFWLQIA